MTSDSLAKFNSYDGVIEYLYGCINYEQRPLRKADMENVHLHRMKLLMSRLGQPELAAPIVHLAGTKGKGSTAAFIAAGLTASGKRTGLYTSPHLERLEERFRVDGQACSEQDLIALTQKLQVAALEVEQQLRQEQPLARGPTFFELVTALAWCYFREQQTDWNVIEVGLGGRLDSTNVCQPAVTIITSISLDHTAWLGDTIPEIAAEKAGIIKPGVPVICGVLDPQAQAVIHQVAQQQQAPLWQVGRDFHYQLKSPVNGHAAGAQAFDFQITGGPSYQRVPLGMAGEHQVLNAAVALAALVELQRQGQSIDWPRVFAAFQTTQVPGRLEILPGKPTCVLDIAHNADSMEALRKSLRKLFPDKKCYVIFATSRDKDLPGMLPALDAMADELIITRFFGNPRARSPENIVKHVKQIRDDRYRILETPQAALDWVLAHAEPDDLICITGSTFLVAELRSAVRAL